MQKDERDLLEVLSLNFNSSKTGAMGVRRGRRGGLNIFSKIHSPA